MTETIEIRETGAPVTASKSSAGLLILSPLLFEANAVRRGVTQQTTRVQRAGAGTKAGKVKGATDAGSFGSVVIMGTAAGLVDDLGPGDLVVATEVTDGTTTVRLPGAALLAGELRRAGLTVRAGAVRTVDHLVKGSER